MHIAKITLISCILALGQFPHATNAEEAPEARKLIAEIALLMDKFKQDSYTATDHKIYIDARNALVGLGIAALPEIENALEKSQNSQLNKALLYVLSQSESPDITKIMVNVLLSQASSEECLSALFYLERNYKNRGSAGHKLSPDELQILANRIHEGSVVSASKYMRAMVVFADNALDNRIEPVLARFFDQIKNPTHSENPHSVVSPRVFTLGLFLDVFKGFGKPAQPRLQRELVLARKASDEALEKWIVLALGNTGDKNVADDVKNIAMNDSDASCRYVALKTFSRLMGVEAIPTLRTAMTDKAISSNLRDWRTGQPIPFIALLARDELEALKENVPTAGELKLNLDQPEN